MRPKFGSVWVSAEHPLVGLVLVFLEFMGKTEGWPSFNHGFEIPAAIMDMVPNDGAARCVFS